METERIKKYRSDCITPSPPPPRLIIIKKTTVRYVGLVFNYEYLYSSLGCVSFFVHQLIMSGGNET